MFECHHQKEKSQNMHNNSNHTRKSFADSMDQSSRAEGERAPSNGERAHHHAYERAVVMKSGVGCERQISAQAEAAEEGEERRRAQRCVDRLTAPARYRRPGP